MITAILSKTNLKLKKTLLIAFSLPIMASNSAYAVLACYAAAYSCIGAAKSIIDDIDKPKRVTPSVVGDRIIKVGACAVATAACVGAP